MSQTYRSEYLQTTKKDEFDQSNLSLVFIGENKNNLIDSLSAAERDFVSLWKTNLSLRAMNVCKRHHFNGRKAIKSGVLESVHFKPLATIADLSMWTKEELLKLQNCGNKTIGEFEDLLNKYGFTLK
jgi:hypothetical protein